MSKISIRFFNDREVRAVWDETESKWWFSALDIIGVLNDQDDYNKNRNYWKYLKTKLKRAGSEVVSATNQLKLLAPDGKRTAFRVHVSTDMYPKTAFRVHVSTDMYPKMAFRVHVISDTYIVRTHSPIC